MTQFLMTEGRRNKIAGDKQQMVAHSSTAAQQDSA
jgi:hypothetical protein